ncbi:methylenetetrahydrofolate reductase [Vulcanisaeta sp. JCM 16159]|uniref:methylenetetrahydrofolate reductase n=1 Tax=Vulcanisaeta sp. JCM 16159 TaxID=1295371 RepID=UPI0006D0C81E|nr:methylenetetrahydrofolate reductase [Vulcanisaeta sp. JCM 16159]
MATIIAELPPLRRIDNASNYLSMISSVVDYVTHVDIPDSTFATPSANAVLIGALIRHSYGNVEVIANIRVADHNKVGLTALIMGGLANGVRNYLLMRGDLGPGVTAVPDLTPISAINYLRSIEQVGGAKFGISISNFDESYIRERLGVKPDFAMLQYTLSMDDLMRALKVSREFNVDVYPALLIITSKSAKVIGRILNTKVPVKPDPIGDAARRARELLQYFPGVYLSAPGDFDAIVETAKALRQYL